MILDLLLFVVGIVLIIAGANYLTEGASTLAHRMGISPLVIGLTVVAFGTSAPELIVSLMSAIKGNSAIALGNVVGSSTFNILGIGGITAIVAPLAVTHSTVRREIPLMILATVVLLVMCFDSLFSGLMSQVNVLSRSDGIVLLGFFAIFLFYTISVAKISPEQSSEQEYPAKLYPSWLLAIFIIGGLGGLVYGGDLFVTSASNIARSFGVSESFIALTIVSIGTSLPELATSVASALKKQPELAVGNIVGSNIFNIFFILGLTSTVTPIRLGGLTLVDLGMMILATLLLYFFGVFFGVRTIKRGEGFFLLLVFIAYTTFLISQL